MMNRTQIAIVAVALVTGLSVAASGGTARIGLNYL
jgi:hypothetical protein